ncbi:MAG: hypothetical protein JW741_13105, partial [Sedimentisphaerales bacterium]|nr:hypothetical protein [Sedimentisphaerales bacterium]
MKKVLVLIAAIALAAPMFASAQDVTITCSDNGDGTATVSYDATAAGVVAGFAFDITVGGDTITGISGYAAEGASVPADSAGVAAGYAIYMGSLNFGTDPNTIDDYGTPVAPAADPGALGGIGTNGITVELGALYTDTPPALEGDLFVIALNDDDASGDTVLTITAEDIRGGIVLEGGAPATLVSTGCTVSHGAVCGDLNAAELAVWNGWGQPANWCLPCWRTGDINGDGFISY